MTSQNTRIIRIAGKTPQTRLSPTQKKFNALLKKIGTQKKRLVAWQTVLPQYRQEIAGELYPLQKEFAGQQAEMAAVLDKAFLTHKFTRNQQEKISHLICTLCQAAIAHGHEDLKLLYNRYSGGNFDAETEEENQMMQEIIKSMLEQEFGIALDDGEFDLSNPQTTAERLAEKAREQQEQAEAARSKRKKTAKQLAAAVRKQEEEAHVSKSIQAVYRQLVSALHPDREQNIQERERKTELMQKVTVAYGNKDLLQLLELQMAIEQINPININNIAEGRLKHYNKVLQSQLQELEDETMMLEAQLRGMAGLSPHAPLTPEHLFGLLHEDIGTLEMEIQRIRHDLHLFQNVKLLKQWINQYRIQPPDPFSDLYEW